MNLPGQSAGRWDLQDPLGDMYATAIETDFGICVEMKNCALAENDFENDFCYPEDETPLTLSWLSSRWHDSTVSMNRNVHKMPGFSLNNSRFVYQTTINYRRSLNLREGHTESISEEVFHRDVDVNEAISRHTEDRQQLSRTSPVTNAVPQTGKCVVTAGPKKMWIRHYYLSKGNGKLGKHKIHWN